jgi:predicted glycogen debranching enzyme
MNTMSLDKSQSEWLETNGLGGWSSSSVIGLHTRRYHGLLVAATEPPTGRMVLLSKLDETIVTGKKRTELSVNRYTGNTIHPAGYRCITAFNRKLFPEWEYEADGIQIKKTIAMIHGANTVVIIYEVLKAASPFVLELLPLMAARQYHSLAQEGSYMHWDVEFDNGKFQCKPDGKTDLYINIPGSIYSHQPRWFYNFQYDAEKERGLDYREDLFNHGVFSVELKEGASLGIIVSTEDTSGKSAFDLVQGEIVRRESLTGNLEDELTRQLIRAADQFIVKRKIKSPDGHEEDGATIIAGYHWFTDWGRDTMISLPGLCLSTGRYEDAKKILAAFGANVSMGMLPNRFQDNGEEPEYNNVDGTLWYFIAIHEYLQATGDSQFILQEILPVLKDIIDWHFKGTRYNIRVEADGLLHAGEAGQQLTWMDARIGNWVVTPRMGKPVEVQALWYNALKIFAGLLRLNGQQEDAYLVDQSAGKTAESFNRKFWLEAGNYLYDVIDGHENADASCRPNQVLAISLPYVLIDGERARSVLQIVADKLYTPVGLRSLSPEDPAYIPFYAGDLWHRDSSYHQGTVWSWLLGPYIDAIMKTTGDKSFAKKIVDNFSYHLTEGAIGSVSEIFDAATPHMPEGCIAQAWGVAEILRVIRKYELNN